MEKLCMFCVHFRWQKEEMWGMGSTLTGPMMEGGDALCDEGHFKGKDIPHYPRDEEDFRKIIVVAQTCPDYQQVSSGRGDSSL